MAEDCDIHICTVSNNCITYNTNNEPYCTDVGGLMIMRLHNKKGEMGFLATMILILVSALVLIIVITGFGKKAGLEGALQACRFSVLAQSYSEVAPSAGGWKSPLDIECNTRYITFKNTEVDAGLDPDVQKPIAVYWDNKKVQKFSNLNDYVVNQVVAEEMRVCFYQFGEGRADIFVNQEYLLKTNVCFICSDFTFDVKGKEFHGLGEFIKKTTITSEGMTYQKYFDKANTYIPFTWSGIAKDYPDTYEKIYSDQHYIVIFKKKYVEGVFGEGTITIDNGIISNGYFVHFMHAEDIGKWCDLVAS
jgi:hypothetical protein